MIGRLISPATTLGKAPSIPATTIDDIRVSDRFQLVQKPMQPGHAHVINPFHPIAHDFGGDNRFLGDGQVAGPGADDGDGSRPFGERFFLDGHATGDRMEDGGLEFFSHQARLIRGQPCDQDSVFPGQNGGRDFHNLRARFCPRRK